MKPFSIFLLMAALIFCLCACSKEAEVPETTQQETTVPETTVDPRVEVEEQTKVSAEEQKVFKEVHEDCLATFAGKDPYAGPGWRYVDNGRTFTEIYKKVREVFNLDAADKLIAAGAK